MAVPSHWRPQVFDGRVWFDVGEPERPPVLLMHELSGMSDQFVAWAEDLRADGFRVLAPALLDPKGRRGHIRSLGALCVRREIHVFATGSTSPIVAWLRRLIAHALDRPYGVIGMCLSGGFALALAVDPSVPVAVTAQPALPMAPSALPVLPGHRRRACDLGLSADDLDRLEHRLAEPGALEVHAFRFDHDPLSPPQRWETLRGLLGDAALDAPHGHRHPTLTGPGNDARRAAVRAFLHTRLDPA